MINIYTEKKNSKDWILQNDLYFNLNTGNEEMSQKEIDLIRQVDEAKLTPDKHIETKYGRNPGFGRRMGYDIKNKRKRYQFQNSSRMVGRKCV